jgi:hypothetical protein
VTTRSFESRRQLSFWGRNCYIPVVMHALHDSYADLFLFFPVQESILFPNNKVFLFILFLVPVVRLLPKEADNKSRVQSLPLRYLSRLAWLFVPHSLFVSQAKISLAIVWGYSSSPFICKKFWSWKKTPKDIPKLFSFFLNLLIWTLLSLQTRTVSVLSTSCHPRWRSSLLCLLSKRLWKRYPEAKGFSSL